MVINGLLIVESNSIFSVITLDLSARPGMVWPRANSLASFFYYIPLTYQTTATQAYPLFHKQAKSAVSWPLYVLVPLPLEHYSPRNLHGSLSLHLGLCVNVTF